MHYNKLSIIVMIVITIVIAGSYIAYGNVRVQDSIECSKQFGEANKYNGDQKTVMYFKQENKCCTYKPVNNEIDITCKNE